MIAAATLLLCLSGQLDSPLAPDLKTGRSFPVSELGKEVGLEVQTPGVLDSQIIFVKSGNSPKEEILARVADTLTCDLKQERDVWRLSKPQAVAAEEAKRASEISARAIGKALKTESERFSYDPEEWAKKLLAGHAEGYVDYSFTAASALLRDLLNVIGPEGLTELNSMSGTVWSSQPTVAERTFPAGFGTALQNYHERNKQLGRILEKRGDVKWSFPDPINQAIFPKPIFAVQLTASRHSNNFHSVLNLYGEDGSILATAALILTLEPEVVTGFRGSEEPLEFSPEIAKILEKKAPGQYVSRQTAEELKSRFLREPLDVVVGPLLSQAAEIHGYKVAAPLPDDLHQVIASAPPKTTKDLFSLFAAAGVTFKEQDGWLIGSFSLKPASLGQVNLDRPQLKQWLEKSGKLGVEWLREECLLAYVSGPGYIGNSLDDWLRYEIITPIHGQFVLYPLVASSTRILLGSLSDQEWGAALRGQPIAITPGSDRSSWMLARSTGTLILSRVDGKELADIAKTGTVAIPNGLPVGSQLRLTVGQLRAMMGGRWKNHPILLTGVPGNMADLVRDVTDAEISAAISGPHAIGFQVGLGVELQYGKELKIDDDFKLTGFTPLKEGIWFTDWPKEWKDEVTKGVKAIKDRSDQTGTARPPATY